MKSQVTLPEYRLYEVLSAIWNGMEPDDGVEELAYGLVGEAGNSDRAVELYLAITDEIPGWGC